MHPNCAKELLVRGFSYSNGNIVALHNNRIFGYSDFMSEIISSEETYKKNIKECWDEIFKTSNDKLYYGESNSITMRIVTSVFNKIQRRLSSGFYGKNHNVIYEGVMSIFSNNSIGYFNDIKIRVIIQNFSSILKYEISLVNIFIIKKLIKIVHEKSSQSIEKLSYTQGISGPFANLDLPMQERVFKWEDVEEETTLRQRDKQLQKRYTMGHDDEPEGFREGFYFREIRNEPYLFEDAATESPYPYRSVLWSQP